MWLECKHSYNFMFGSILLCSFSRLNLLDWIINFLKWPLYKTRNYINEITWKWLKWDQCNIWNWDWSWLKWSIQNLNSSILTSRWVYHGSQQCCSCLLNSSMQQLALFCPISVELWRYFGGPLSFEKTVIHFIVENTPWAF